MPTSTHKLYAARDHYQLSPQYERHLLAMTAEGLYSKSAIAAELAHRDIEIERLRDELQLARIELAQTASEALRAIGKVVIPSETKKAEPSSFREVAVKQVLAAIEAWNKQDGRMCDHDYDLMNDARQELQWILDDHMRSTRSPVEPTRELTLRDFGYAPGNYTFKCHDCGQEAVGDKRTLRCETCAAQALRENRRGAVNGTGDAT